MSAGLYSVWFLGRGFEKFFKMYFILGLAAAMGLTIYLSVGVYDGYRREELSMFAAAAWAATVFMGGMTWMSSSRPSSSTSTIDSSEIDREILKKIRDLPSREEIQGMVREAQGVYSERAETIQINNDDRDYLSNVIRSQVEEKLTSDVVAKLQNGLQEVAARKFGEEVASGLKTRLRGLAADLGIRSGINLMAGVSFAGFGIYLIYSGLDGGPTSTSIDYSITWLTVAKYYLPRGGMVLLVEVLAFFFLRLYRRTLDEIKYVHNELTNVESRILALANAVNMNDGKLVAACIQALVKTERNFVLKKGETTIELEMSRAESSLARDVVKDISGLSKHIFGKAKAE
ncbi:MAG: hypothetical protein H7Y60_10925 [Rhodospirillaceae bacterium]|nr:hypothetical protein [Rhodospirillales bacterium]